MQEFDAYNCPIKGKNMIEASAGTGKTYNIQILVLRVLLETRTPLQKILVVTFTVFATAELMERLHAILLLTDRALELCSKDASAINNKEFDQIRAIVVKQFINANDEKRKECRTLIKNALRDFDQAPVMTIHGFCNRMLSDNAFASRVSFGAELKTDVNVARKRIATDFIRMIRCSNDSTFTLGKKLQEKVTADFLLKNLTIAIESAESRTDIKWSFPSNQKWQDQLQNLNMCPAEDDDQKKELTEKLGPCFLAYYQEQMEKFKAENAFLTFNDLIRKMADIVKDEAKGKELIEAIRKSFSYAFVDEFQDTDPLQYDIFSTIFGAPNFNGAFFMIGDPKQAIYSFRGGDIHAYKKAQEATQKDNPEKLFTITTNFRSSEEYINCLKKFFESCLRSLNVPEIKFGKTERGFLRKHGQPVKLLQFRQEANVEAVVPSMLQKIQELLSPACDYTLFNPKKNEFEPVKPSDIAILFPKKAKGKELEAQLNAAGIDTIWMSDSNIFRGVEAKALYELLSLLYEGCSFPRILSVLAGDIFQCTAKELSRLQKKGVFEENELAKYEGKAEEAQTYFLALKQMWEKQGFYSMFSKLMFTPNREDKQWLLAIRDDVQGRFEENGSWAQHLIHVKFVEGRYTLGRLRQLGDLLHQAELEKHLTPGRLLNYLLAQIQNVETEDDMKDDSGKTRALIQRSTDLPAVRMLTLHSSKGLQFPIVLIPFFITDRTPKSRLFHDEKHNRCLDMTGWSDNKRDNAYKTQCEKEELEEKVRLLYVGLTRAKFFCFLDYSVGRGVYAGLRNQLGELPDEFLADEPDPNINQAFSVTIPDDDSSVARSFGGSINQDWNLASFSGFTHGYHGSGQRPKPSKTDTPEDAYGGTDERIFDEDKEPQTTPKDMTDKPLSGDEMIESIFRFGLGTEMGTVWHEIFEKMDFNPKNVSQDEFFHENECEALLAAIKTPSLYNSIRRQPDDDVDRAKRDLAFARMLKGILFNPLGELDTPGGDRFQLSQISVEQRVSELKFMFVLGKNVSLQQIKACLERYKISTGTWASSASALYQNHAMIGFIDLLCRSNAGKYYIIDWKSNTLHYDLTEFDRDGMQREIDKALYSLQFLIYTVALWHFLKARQNLDLTPDNYEKFFGGVLYLFVRGIAAPLPGMTNPEKKKCMERGIYYSLPPYGLIKELKELLDLRQLSFGTSAISANEAETR